MNAEKYIFRDSMEPEEAWWGDFAACFKEEMKNCPPLTEVGELADSDIPLADLKSVSQDHRLLHIATCPTCGPYYECIRTYGTEATEDQAQEQGSVGGRWPDRIKIDTGYDVTNVLALSRRGRKQDTLDRVFPILPLLLQQINFDANLVWPLRKELTNSILDDEDTSDFPTIFSEFTRKHVLPFYTVDHDWEDTVDRIFLQKIQASLEPNDVAHYVIQEFLNQKVITVESLSVCWAGCWEQHARGPIQSGQVNDLLIRFLMERGSFAEFFRLRATPCLN